MSKRTFFKRLALSVIAAMGLGLLSAPLAPAVRLNTTLTLSSTTATASVGDTATGSWVLRASATQDSESYTVRYTCDAPVGASCPGLRATQTPTSDTFNVTQLNDVRAGFGRIFRLLVGQIHCHKFHLEQCVQPLISRRCYSLRLEPIPTHSM